MTNKQFFTRLAKELHDNTHPTHQHLVKDLQITSLPQVLGIIRSVMIRNNNHMEEAVELRKNLKELCNVIGIDEKDL